MNGQLRCGGREKEGSGCSEAVRERIGLIIHSHGPAICFIKHDMCHALPALTLVNEGMFASPLVLSSSRPLVLSSSRFNRARNLLQTMNTMALHNLRIG